MRIGIDLGGTKTEAVALDGDGNAIWRERVATPRGCYDAILEVVVRLVQRAEHALGRRCSVGVGIPGALSPASGRVKNANTTELIGRHLDHDLAAALERPVRISNDANCFALSEACDGAGRGAEIVFGVILGTGVGGGVAVNARVLRGANAIAGEWGHMPLPSPASAERPGSPCYCGRHGCVETWLSGPGLSSDHERATGRWLSAERIAQQAQEGEATCRRSIARYEARLARSLAVVIDILDPDVIVLGGGLSGIARLYENVPALWAEHVFSDRVDTRLLPPQHGDASGVRGAARLWPPGE
jgi:fructokinase